MHTLMMADGIDDIMDFELVPWGNAYVASEACPTTSTAEGYPLYNVTARECWNDKCGAGDGFDCFTGEYIYQHSPSEGLADVIEACAAAGQPRSAWWPFVYCFEGLALNYCPCGDSCDLDDCDLHYSGAPQIYLKDYAPSGTQNVPYNKSLADAYIADAGRKCAGTVGLDWSAIAACALSDPEDPTSWPAATGSKLEMASATKTAKLQPEHSGVPWVVVDVSPPPAFLRAKTRPPRRGHRSRTRPRSSRPSAPPPRPRASCSRRAATRTPGRRRRRLAALARHMTAPHPIPPGRTGLKLPSSYSAPGSPNDGQRLFCEGARADFRSELGCALLARAAP